MNSFVNICKFCPKTTKSISKAVNSGADLFGSTISVANIRGPESVTGIHGTPKAPCDVCKPLLGYYGITVVT